jgi:PadR family transcriptional regulator PadR
LVEDYFASLNINNILFGNMFCIVPFIGYKFAIQNSSITMKIENTKAQMRKGVLEYCILAILKNGEAYPSDILMRLKKANLIVVEGTIYPLLTRLKNSGLLSYRWEESKSGPPRKYYTITSSGVTFLSSLDETWKELVKAVRLTIKTK